MFTNFNFELSVSFDDDLILTWQDKQRFSAGAAKRRKISERK
jgi:hypothetical protein